MLLSTETAFCNLMVQNKMTECFIKEVRKPKVREGGRVRLRGQRTDKMFYVTKRGEPTE